MIIAIRKNSVTTFLLFLSCLIIMSMIFTFFGRAIEQVLDGSIILSWNACTLFEFVFGNKGIPQSAGITVLFSFQIALMSVALFYIVYIFLGASNKKMCNVLSFIILILLVVAIIMAVLTKVLIKDSYVALLMKEYGWSKEKASAELLKEYPGVRISSGAISYIILGTISFFSLLIGAFLNNSEDKTIKK